MTLYEAYLKAKDDANRDGLTLLLSCCDFGDFWGFNFIQQPQKNDINGGGYVTVDKESGGVGNFTPLMNFDLFTKGKPISIDQFAERAKVA